MMKLRPIIIDSEGMILGGNMRFKAIKELGYKDVPDEWVKRDGELTNEEKQRFIIADNIEQGEWNWEYLSEWNIEKLIEWGMPEWNKGIDINNMTDEDIDLNQEFDPYGLSKGFQRVVFIFNGSKEAENYLKKHRIKYKKMNNAWQVNLITQSIL